MTADSRTLLKEGEMSPELRTTSDGRIDWLKPVALGDSAYPFRPKGVPPSVVVDVQDRGPGRRQRDVGPHLHHGHVLKCGPRTSRTKLDAREQQIE
jgi:hypothetical protein